MSNYVNIVRESNWSNNPVEHETFLKEQSDKVLLASAMGTLTKIKPKVVNK
jgi:hypothetical protein